jgi:hypothetical protein
MDMMDTHPTLDRDEISHIVRTLQLTKKQSNLILRLRGHI